MEIDKALEILQLTLPFTEDELKKGYRIALLQAGKKADKERMSMLTSAFWTASNYIRTNPFINDKEKAKEVKDKKRDSYTIYVVEKCKKCAPKHIGRGLYISSGRSTIVCPKCNGQKQLYVPSQGGRVVCSKCKGAGVITVTCKYCKGKGRLNLKRKVFALHKKEVEEQNEFAITKPEKQTGVMVVKKE